MVGAFGFVIGAFVVTGPNAAHSPFEGVAAILVGAACAIFLTALDAAR